MASKKFASVWDALSDTPEQAADMRARSELMRAINGVIKRHGWTQAEAGQRAGITQPRANELVNGRISKFSLDALVRIAAALGLQVHIEALEVA